LGFALIAGAEPVGTVLVVAAPVVVDDIGRAVASHGVVEALVEDTDKASMFERLGRYESALARQIYRCYFFLRSTRRR